MLLNAPYPSDIRVKKESDALIAAGYSIHLLCLRKAGEPTQEIVEGIHVVRIDAGKNNYELAFWDVIMSIRFVHPRFRKAAAKIIEGENISLIHSHDLPMAGTALSLKKNYNVKVVADFHENYPEALRTWFKWKRNPIARIKNFLFLNPKRWEAYEHKVCQEADHVIAVVEEMKERLQTAYKTESQKITVVTNTEDKNFLRQSLDLSVYDKMRPGFIITYSGGIGPHRGVDTAIKGMAHLRHMPIKLAIVGFGSPSVMKSLLELTQELKLENVYFLGYQPFSKFYSYMHEADANVIPHQSNGHTDNTVPHKLFQGMMTGKPLIVSSCAPLKRLVEKYQCGVVFEAGDDMDFATAVGKLFENKELQKQLGANGYHHTVEGELNWETTQHELITLYKKLL